MLVGLKTDLHTLSEAPAEAACLLYICTKANEWLSIFSFFLPSQATAAFPELVIELQFFRGVSKKK